MKRSILFAVAAVLFAPVPSAHAQRLDRLERLADYLERSVPSERFDMSHWSNGEDPRSESYTACAGGWAVPLFAHEGLAPQPLTGHPLYRGRNGFGAMQEFFEVDYSGVERLFGAECRTLTEEVALIRRYCAERRRLPELAGGGIALAAR